MYFVLFSPRPDISATTFVYSRLTTQWSPQIPLVPSRKFFLDHQIISLCFRWKSPIALHRCALTPSSSNCISYRPVSIEAENSESLMMVAKILKFLHSCRYSWLICSLLWTGFYIPFHIIFFTSFLLWVTYNLRRGWIAGLPTLSMTLQLQRVLVSCPKSNN